jgi:putative membrane-bound dehydrogenase-like protein
MTKSSLNQPAVPSPKNRIRRALFAPTFVLLVALLLGAACGLWESKGPYDTDPLEPADALKAFQIVEGFKVELFAAEPEVVDPVEITFDENGNAYVAEMLDYPFDPAEGVPPRSRIRFLEDTDADGRIDRATIFADQLLQVTSVLPWKGGVLATSAPDILYLKDTDGDHKADLREVWFTGFETHTVSPESRITNLRFGIDNWIYAANNGRPGEITSPKWPDRPPVIVRGYDVRFHPLTGAFEPATGPTQFGMTFDEWGNRFMSQNTVHLRHAVLPAPYVLANRFFAPGAMLQYIPQDNPSESTVYPLTQPQQWRVERTEARQERYDETQPGRQELVGGHFTAATGATAYTGDAFPAEFRGDVFVADANGNLVHRDILKPLGATFTAERWPKDRELLASTDVWFRPVNMANAPDGNLYILDFYREYIEEPASIPEAIKQRLQLDFYRGDDLGRIYRLAPASSSGGRGLQSGLANASTQTLVATLAHANGWHRLTAQRLLLERQDSNAIPALEKLARESESPLGRLHALWTLDGLSALTAEHVAAALKDQHAEIRRHAIRLAEKFLPAMTDAVLACADDPDPKVQFQLLLTLGQIPGSERALARLAAEHRDDLWFRAAALLSVRDRPMQVLTRMLTSHADFFDLSASDGANSAAGGAQRTAAEDPTTGRRAFLRGLASIVGARRESAELRMFFVTIDGSRPLRPAPWRAALLAGLADGLALEGGRGLREPSAAPILARFLSDSSDGVREAAFAVAPYFHLPGLIRDALAAAPSEDISIERRERAVRFLRGGEFDAVAPVLSKILNSPSPQELQAAAVATLAYFDDPETPALLLAGWQGYSPAVRSRAAEALLGKRGWAGALLDAVEKGTVSAGAIDPVSRIRLTQYPEEAVRQRAERLLAAEVRDRAQVIEAHRGVSELPTDLDRGRIVFEEHCAQCHLARADRGRIGPDLSGINNRSKEELLTHILDPSFEIQPNYTNYLVVAKDGRVFDGLLIGETAHTVTLRGEYNDVTIPREAIEQIRPSEVSLMPEGLEQDLDHQQLADVIAYLRAGL